MEKLSRYPRKYEKVKVIIHWGRSKLNGEHIGYVTKRPFRARSGAVLRPFKCEICNKEHCIPWTSREDIIEFYRTS